MLLYGVIVLRIIVGKLQLFKTVHVWCELNAGV